MTNDLGSYFPTVEITPRGAEVSTEDVSVAVGLPSSVDGRAQVRTLVLQVVRPHVRTRGVRLYIYISKE